MVRRVRRKSQARCEAGENPEITSNGYLSLWCAYTQYLGTYVYKNHGAGTEDSWTCPSCGSHTWVLQSQQPASCTANGYAYYSCACGQTKSEMIYASGHNYSYGNWMQYSSSQHQRSKYCMNCGSSDYEYDLHPVLSSAGRTHRAVHIQLHGIIAHGL